VNNFIQNLFLILIPFYPFWAWLGLSLLKRPIELFASFILIPIVIYFLIFENKKLPKYLILLIIFTIYHLISVFINDTIPEGSSKLYFLLVDRNILACMYFFIIEHSVFNKKFINKMNSLILIIVIITLIVSLIQTKFPTFFFYDRGYESLDLVGRCSSIFSWININSLGISFPFLVSILLSVYNRKKFILPIVILSGIVVPFLTRAKYVMISGIVVLSQLFFNSKISIFKKASLIGLIIGLILISNLAADKLGYDINEVINNRILGEEGDNASVNARIISYEVFLIVFPEHPWLGVGPKTRKDVRYLLGESMPVIHVGYLSYLYFYGIAGCLILFLAIFYLLKDAWFVGRKYNFWGSFYGLLAFCLANLTFVYLNFDEMGIIISIIYLKHFNSISSSKKMVKNLNNPSRKVLFDTKS